MSFLTALSAIQFFLTILWDQEVYFLLYKYILIYGWGTVPQGFIRSGAESSCIQFIVYAMDAISYFFTHKSLSSYDDDGYVTLIRSSGFRQSSCAESKPHLGCLLWNSSSLQKGFPRLQFFPRREFKIPGRSLVGREQERYRSCEKLRAVFSWSSNFMPLCDAMSFGSQELHCHVLILLLCKICTNYLASDI